MLFSRILFVFFSLSCAAATSVDLTIIERIRACGERLGNNERIPNICYRNPDAQGTDFQTSRNLARGKRSNLLFRGHHPTCSKPCQRSSLFMDPNVSRKKIFYTIFFFLYLFLYSFSISSFLDFILAFISTTTMAQNSSTSAAAAAIALLTSNHCKFRTDRPEI